MSKKENKENICEVAYDDMTIWENFFIENWRKIFQFCAVVVAVIAVYMLARYYMQRQDEAVSRDIAKAGTAPELEAVVEKYGSRKEADIARMRLAQIYFNDKKYDQAARLYTQLGFSQDPSTSLRAKLNMAYVLEVQDKKADAAAKFAEISGGIGLPEDTRFEAAYNAARLQKELGQLDKARASLEVFDNLGAESAENFWAKKADKLKGFVKNR